MYGVIYLIINLHNLKNCAKPFLYIGSTTRSGKNFESYFGSSTYLKEDVTNLGINKFKKIKLLESNNFSDVTEILNKETEFQKKFDAVNSDLFYNKAYAIGNFFNIDGSHTSNTIWINDGRRNKRISERDVEKYPTWNKGRLGGKYMKDRVYINNGLETKSISKSDLHLFPDWNIGRLKGNQSNKVWVNNSIIRKLISKNELNSYLSENWTIGWKIKT